MSARKIFKYALSPGELPARVCVMMPTVSHPISVGIQGGQIVVWAEVEETSLAERWFWVVPTGVEFERAKLRFLGTVQSEGSLMDLAGSVVLVFHIYVEERPVA